MIQAGMQWTSFQKWPAHCALVSIGKSVRKMDSRQIPGDRAVQGCVLVMHVDHDLEVNIRDTHNHWQAWLPGARP